MFIDNDFYYATANDLRVYNLQSRKISDLSDLIDPLLSNAEFLKLVAEDQNLWIATTEGLIRLEKKKKIFQPLLAGANISTREMYAISEDSILLCTERGLYLVDSRTNKVQDVLNEKEEFYGISRLSDANYLLGIYGPGSYVVNLEKGTLDKKIYKNEKDFRVKTKESHLNSILDENGRLWLSGNKGICTYDSVANGLKCYHFDEEANIYCHEITDGREKQHLFLLTHAGLLDFDVQTYRYKQYESLKSKAISFITKDLDHDSIYWVATKYEGLLKWEYDGKVMDVINVEDGLGHNNVHSVFEDNHKRLWLSTDYGISVYNKETKEISVITEENGIHENEMNRHSHCFVNDSLILYGSINGVIKFNPYDVQFDATFGELNLKALSFRNRSENVLESIPIKKDESKLTIRRNQEDPKLLFDIPEKSYSNTLRYLFSSGDKDWTYTQGNSIDLSTIKDGQTNLFVSKKTGINEWSSPSTIAIYKPVPFYKAYWFYGLLFCLFSIGALIYINQRRVRAIKLNKRISREVEMKTKELYHKNQSLTESKRLNEQLFTIIGHDLRSPLISLNNISKSLNYLTARGEYEEVKKLSQTIESNSKKSLNIIDRLIDWTEKQKSSMLELHKVLLVGCIQKSVGEHQEFADKKNIEIKVEAKQAVVCISNESSLMVVLGNVIANAIKFSPRNSEITIDVDHRGAEIVIEVKDQGIGMDSEQLHKLNNAMPVEPILSTEGEAGLGMGLLLSAEIIKKIKGHMEFFSEKGKGTSVLIKLPQ
ncbi:MAG: ATP-binding protein [Bacteroidota bacterium]